MHCASIPPTFESISVMGVVTTKICRPLETHRIISFRHFVIKNNMVLNNCVLVGLKLFLLNMSITSMSDGGKP